jgi:superkiller protein 3
MANKQAAKRLNGAASSETKRVAGATNGRSVQTNGHKKHVLPVIREAAPAPPPAPRPRQSTASETELRYWLASLVRLSDNIVLKAVSAYNRIFELKNEDQADIYLAMARDFERDGKLEDVLEALHKAVILRPEDGRIRMQIGILRLKAKAPAAAVQAFQQAKDFGYTSFRLHVSMAEAFVMLNEHERAVTEYQHALAIDSDSADALHKLGIALDRLGRFQEAAAAFQRAVEVAPHEVLFHQSLGFALESAGRRSEAVKCFKRALELEQLEQREQQSAE